MSVKDTNELVGGEEVAVHQIKNLLIFADKILPFFRNIGIEEINPRYFPVGC